MTTKVVGNRLQKLATQWPADPFRPHLQLKTFLESLSHHPNLTDEAVTATRSLLQNDLRHKVRRCLGVPGVLVFTSPPTLAHSISLENQLCTQLPCLITMTDLRRRF